MIIPRYAARAGLAPEKVRILEGVGFEVDELDTGNVLRPEAVESLYYMWRLTGEQKYREWGWDIFKAFQKHAKGEAGYHALLVRPRSPGLQTTYKEVSCFSGIHKDGQS